MSARTDKLKARFKIGSHYAMERFGILFCLIFVMFVVLFAWGGKTKIERSREELSSQVLYPSSYMTSKTRVLMTPLGVFSNERNDSVVLLMSIGDRSKVGVRAEDYMVALTAQSPNEDPEPLETRPAVGFYVYKDSGYMAVTFQSSEPFPRQIIYAMFRNVQDLSGDTTSSGALSSVYDIWTVAFNPAADDRYKTSAFTDDGAFNPDAFYNEIIVSQQEKRIRQTLESDIDSLDSQLTIIENYEARVEKDGVSVSDMIPKWVKGDVVLKGEGTSESGEEGIKTFMPSVVATGGYDFDWRGGNVNDGYIESLMRGSSAESPAKFIDMNKAVAAEFEVPQTDGEDSLGYDWKLQTGESLKDAMKYDTSAGMKSTVADVKLLEQAWADYAKMKYGYQVSDLTSLLELELSVQSVKGEWTAELDQSHVTFLDD